MEHDFGKLLRHIVFNVNSFIGQRIRIYGLRQGQLDYFLHIADSPGINQLELAKAKNVGKASVTKALKILEDGGFIIRKPDKTDRRNMVCFITEKGAAIASKLMAVKSVTLEKLFEGFEIEEKEHFYHYLLRLNKNASSLENITMADNEEI